MIGTTEVFELINNLDCREAIRRYGPAWSIVVVGPTLHVVALSRFKERPTLVQVGELLFAHKGCAYFYVNPGMYKTVEALEEKVRACDEAIRMDSQGIKP